MFHRCKSVSEVKELFSKISKQLLPNENGENDLVELLIDSRNIALNEIRKEHEFDFAIEDISRNDKRTRILVEIANFAKQNDFFDMGFPVSVYRHLKKNGYITAKQFNALVKIYNKFSMEKERSLQEKKLDETYNSVELKDD